MKPQGYNSVSPYLIVDDAAALIDFLVTVFDGEDLRRYPDDSGRLRHAEVRVDDSIVMLADEVEG
ncbi:MAG TPA: VOC family protein, partial [Acidimicrobiia bacterium]|nr:VOC family protein [Acidimicrobiia bacterium]